MTAEQYHRVKAVFHLAIERAPAERVAFLEEACAGDSELRAEVERLLACDQQESRFMETPACIAEDALRLPAGTRLGSYQVLSPLGSGGMGEVYRAKDTKLGRDVALKVLPASLAHEPEGLARFEHEAQLLAALNHPHIAQIHGLEEWNGVRALVMELVDGPTLADRMACGPIPLDEALPIAKQIAEALEAAHEQGIVHRDLKPANIKVRGDGTVKVVDFGLAKAFDPGGSSITAATKSPPPPNHATQAGIILGTAAYMAPEQARGKTVDRRADIWAFGVVLFEMLTGRRVFAGDDISITLATVLKSEPDWSALPEATPPSLRRLLSRCLNKNPKDRLQAIGDARVEIGELLSGLPEFSMTSAVPAAPLWRRASALAAVVFLTASVTGFIEWFAVRSTTARPQVSRFAITPPSAAALSINGASHDVAITPDGSRLVYVGANGTTLFVRPLDRLETTPLVRGDSLRDPFVSPDGLWVGFFDGAATLKKVALTGGPAVLVAQVDATEQGATWAADGTIVIATVSGLQRVSADGGVPAMLSPPDHTRGEARYRLPEQLPGGRAVLYTVWPTTGGLDAASIAVLDLRSGRSTILLRGGSDARYATSGHLVYAAAGGTLRAIGFDLSRGIVVGTPTTVVPQVLTTALGAVDAVLARDGTLLYVAGDAGTSVARTLVWVDRQGRETPTGAPPRAYGQPRVSPDGTRIAVAAVVDQHWGVWQWDLRRATLTPLTFGSAVEAAPVWMPDGRVVFSSTGAGGLNLYSQAADGTGVERLTESLDVQIPTAVSPDGRQLVFIENSAKTGLDVMALQLDGSRQVRPLAQTPFSERNGIVSPDGRWLAYEANDSGPFEVYVRSFGAVNSGRADERRWKVSTSGGTQPLWGRGGRELFYFAPNGALMRVDVAAGSAWTAGTPTKELEGRYVVNAGGGNFQRVFDIVRNYDIAADGQRFLMIKPTGSDATVAPPQLVVVQHFDEELKRLVPWK
jgi:serine/threonine-protein kinase